MTPVVGKASKPAAIKCVAPASGGSFRITPGLISVTVWKSVL